MKLPPIDTSFLIPYRADGGWRDTIFRLVWARLASSMLDIHAEYILWGDGGHDPGLFNHPKAINRCASKARGDVFVVVDADTTFREPTSLITAIADSRIDGRWRLPQTYITLTETATRAIVSGKSGVDIGSDDIEWQGDAVSWSGIVIIPAAAFWEMRGADERYLGWGADDAALGLALETLYGTHVRYPGAAVHLWHPRGTQENGLHAHGDEGRALTQRYVDAAGNREMMQALVDEKETV